MRIKVLASTPNPQQTCWLAMHQCYAEHSVIDAKAPSEDESGRLLIKHLLAGNRGHYGPLEHPSITFGVAGFPHSTIVQARTHRVGTTFDVQSQRYTSKRILETPETSFYVRPVGSYASRSGGSYAYTQAMQDADMANYLQSAKLYKKAIEAGVAEEHARDLLSQAVVQDFVCSFNCRSLMHFLDLRSKLDAQFEIRQLCELMFVEFKHWMPEIANWYETTRLHKARLSP